MSTRGRMATLSLALCALTSAVNLQAPLYADYAQAGGFGATASTLAFAAYALGVIPVLFYFGGLSDALGRRKVLMLALVCSFLATALMLWHPQWISLAFARWMLGVGTALATATAPAYMSELALAGAVPRATNWVTLSTALGFGLGAAMTSVSLWWHWSLRPTSFWVQLGMSFVALVGVASLPETVSKRGAARRFGWPSFPNGSGAYGAAIFLSWATVGWVIALLPFAMRAEGLSQVSGWVVFGVCSCGVLFQPFARRLAPEAAARRGLLFLPLAFALLAYGVTQASWWAVMLGAVSISGVSYGFVYLGGLSSVVALAGRQTTRATAGFFVCAYVGFSVPVVVIALLVDRLGRDHAVVGFGILLCLGVAAVYPRLRPISNWAAKTPR